MLPNEVVTFAAGDTSFYDAAVEHYHNPTPEHAALINKAFFSEIERKSGVKREGLAPEAWVTNPSVQWVK